MTMASREVRTWSLRLAILFMAATVLTAQQDQRPTFRVTTDVVTTELRVRDASGKFIPNLSIEDFELFEDGVRQKITNMMLTVGGRTMTQLAPAAGQPSEGLILPPVVQSRKS